MEAQLKEGFSRWPKSINQACKRAFLFKSLKEKVNEVKSEIPIIEDYNQNILKIQPLLRESSDIEKEGYSQVIFKGSPWASLNTIPFALTFLSIYKSYIVPGISLLLPIIMCLLPYILLKAFYNIPITFTEYTGILWRMWNGQPLPKTPEEILKPVQGQQDAISILKQLAQNGWTLFTVGQTMWQPIQQARHFKKLDTECSGFGDSIVRVKGIVSGLCERWEKFFPKWFPSWIRMCPDEGRRAFAFIQDYSYWLPHLRRVMGRFEVIYKLARRNDVVPVEFVSSKNPILMLKDFGDPSIPFEERITTSVKCNGHTIITGPNRGGKSSFLRGILMNIKFAHAYGACFASKAQMSYFTWIADGLRLADIPGKTSMFEREVQFASKVLEKKGGCGIVLYDELFHSTNPPDAERTSRVFCNELWKKDNCISFISTHVYSLAEDSPKNIEKLCLASWKDKNNEYTFSYMAQKGICKVSSVDLLLEQYGWIKSADY